MCPYSRSIMILNNLLVCFIVIAIIEAQNPEINDQFSETNANETEITDVTYITEPQHQRDTTANPNQDDKTDAEVKTQNATTNNTRKHETYHIPEVYEIQEPNFIVKLYNAIENAITNFLASQKVMYVLHNIGTCVVNGVMDLITFYLPAPMIPLIASAAGMIVPFEPVVTLREKMPVTSYRRAFDRAVNSFMGTFDKYKSIDVNEDPYMTRRFNRRFMNDERSKEEKRNVL